MSYRLRRSVLVVPAGPPEGSIQKAAGSLEYRARSRSHL